MLVKDTRMPAEALTWLTRGRVNHASRTPVRLRAVLAPISVNGEVLHQRKRATKPDDIPRGSAGFRQKRWSRCVRPGVTSSLVKGAARGAATHPVATAAGRSKSS